MLFTDTLCQIFRSGSRSGRTLLLLTAGAAAAALAIKHLCGRRKARQAPLPPGPRGWPLLGSLPSMDMVRMHESIAQLSSQYGPLMSFRLGSQLFIIVNDLDMSRTMLNDDNYSGRCQSVIFQRQSAGCGLLFSEGANWQRHRRLALTTLRNFGFAREVSATIVDRQLDNILDDMQTASDSATPFTVLEIFSEASNAVIATLTLGRQFTRGSQELEFIRDAASGLFATRPLHALSFLFPWLDWMLRLIPETSEFTRLTVDNQAFIRRQIEQRRELMGQDVEAFEPECLCDVYLKERKRAEAQGDFETFKDHQIISVIMDLFFAGTDTTARSMEWLLIYLAFEQDWQSRVQTELDRVVSRERRPRMQDEEQLPKTRAVIEEVYRLVSLSPLGMFHRARNEGTVFNGYRIPTDALIFPFVYGISRDPRLWTQPERFNPERFLTPDGLFDKRQAEKNVPFSVGRRVCAGKSLARMEVFLMLTAVMQRFRVRIASEFEDKQAEILRGTAGILRLPGDYKLLFEARG